jgi:polar amino acid transport system substrate-binding protein
MWEERMKLLLMSVFATAVAMATPTTADVLSDVKSAGKLVCGVLGVNEPFGYQDVNTRELVGYEVDACRLLAEDLGVEPEIKVVVSQSRIPELSQRRVDVLAALLSYTPERAEQVDFSKTYLTMDSKCVVLDESEVKALDSLASSRVAILKGSVLEAPFRTRFPDATILSLDDTSTSFLALYGGRVEASCNNEVTARLVISRSTDAPKMRFLPELVLQAKAGFVVKKGEQAFLDYINGFLERLESSGKGQALFDKWLGKDSKLGMERAFTFGEPIKG